MATPDVGDRVSELVIIEAGQGDRLYWRDVWRFRDLLAVLAWRDISVRYKQTLVGVAWALIQPLLTMAILVFVFSRLAGFPSDGDTPYALLVLSAIAPWQLFSAGLGTAGMSLVSNASLVSKVYFPRILLPLAAMSASLVDFVITLALLGVLMLILGVVPDVRILALPVFIAMTLVVVAGPTIALAALNVRYRDFRYVVPFALQFGLYVTPVGFTTAIVREQVDGPIGLLYYLNPMAGVIDGFRWSLFASPLYWPGLLVSLVVACSVAALAVRYFRRAERAFADLI